MMERARPYTARYGTALVVVAVALGLGLTLPPCRTSHCHLPLLVAAVALASARGGLGPGLLSVALSSAAVLALATPLPPAGAGGLTGLEPLAALLLAALPVTWLGVSCRRLAADVKGSRGRLAAAVRHHEESLALLAHELRNPLGATRSALHLLRQSPAPADSARAVDLAERQVRQMTRLIDRLLDVTRVACGKVELSLKKVDLAGVVADAVATVRPRIDAHGHDLHVALPDSPLWLSGDPTWLAQVVGNLLDNAAKYTEPGGRIRVTAGREGREVVLRVADTGVGIAPEAVPQIFDLFAQVDGCADRRRSGLGIGLALVRRLVELHGGRVQVTSAGPHRGSEFTLRLPGLPAWPTKGVTPVMSLLEEGPPVDTIVRRARDLNADLVVIGAGNPSRSGRSPAGPIATAVIEHATVPVLAVHPGRSGARFRKVLCAVDQSGPAARGLSNAIQLARALGGQLIVLTVVPAVTPAIAAAVSGRFADEQTKLDGLWRGEFMKVLDEADLGGLPVTREVRHGQPHRQILEAVAQHQADLIVMGATGRTGLARVLIGSTTRRVLEFLPCSLLTVKHQGGEGDLSQGSSGGALDS